LTQIHAEFDGDTFMKPIGSDWEVTAHEDFPADEDLPAYSFVTYHRREEEA
ncbi:MAG: dihydrofolate reductase, partial [Altererythrobacter sp.]|nr:dihydrofolate reductase [Altererythrobacter sp.]